MATIRKICVGQFLGAHGVRGLVKLRSFTEKPEAIFDYAPLLDQDGGRVFEIALKSVAQNHFIVGIDGVNDKEAADLLRGDKVFIPRDLLPAPKEGEYYEADLVGLEAVDEKGTNFGSVMGVYDYGAGVFLEIGMSRKDSFMLPFKDHFVPKVDLDAGRIEIVVPEGWV